MDTRDWAVGVLWSLALFTGGCGLLSSGDQLPPALGPEDLLVVPSCLVLPGGEPPPGSSIDQSVTIIGRRKDSTGAEGVAVSVRIGTCSGADGGLLTPAEGQRLPKGCAGAELSADDWSDISVFPVPSNGCTGLSNRELACLLSPDGNAQFTVQVVGTPLVSSGYIPICVSANAIERTVQGGIDHHPRNATIGVFFSTNITSSELGINYSAPTPQPGSDCANLQNCGVPQPVRLTVSLSSSPEVSSAAMDGGKTSPPATEADGGDLEGGSGSAAVAPRDVDVAVAVHSEVPSADVTTPYFSATGCQDSAGTSIDVRIPAGALQSQPFYLCASSMESRYFVEAVLIDNTKIRGNREIPVAPAVQRIVFAGGDASVANFKAQLCGQTGTVAPPGGLFVSSLEETPAKSPSSPPPKSQPSAPDSGTDGPVDAAPASDSGSTQSVVLRSAHLILGTGAECTLKITP